MDYWYISAGEVSSRLEHQYGGNRCWDDCRRYGFISAGQDRKYSDRLKKLKIGDAVFAYLKRQKDVGGYVGYGRITTDLPIMVKDFMVGGKPLLGYDLKGSFLRKNVSDPDRSEYIVGVDWHVALRREDGLYYKGIFSSQHIVCRLTNEDTLLYLRENFGCKDNDNKLEQVDQPKGVTVNVIPPEHGDPKTSIHEMSSKKIHVPEWLKVLLESIAKLRADPAHLERAHESLVESFFENLGYEKFTDIKHQQGRMDLSIRLNGNYLAVVEVKKSWGLTIRNRSVLRQAYDYAKEYGAKYVIITNGDYYAFFDQEQGRTYGDNLMQEFHLTNLIENNMQFIDSIKKMA